jgi:hypothetical protein
VIAWNRRATDTDLLGLLREARDAYEQADKALQAIEAANIFIDNGISDWENADRKALERFAHDGYAIAHSMQPARICYSVHDDWRKQADEVLRASDQAGLSKYEMPPLIARIDAKLKEVEG